MSPGDSREPYGVSAHPQLCRTLGPASGRERIVSRSTQPRPDTSRRRSLRPPPPCSLQLAACRQLLAAAALADGAAVDGASRLPPTDVRASAQQWQRGEECDAGAGRLGPAISEHSGPSLQRTAGVRVPTTERSEEGGAGSEPTYSSEYRISTGSGTTSVRSTCGTTYGTDTIAAATVRSIIRCVGGVGFRVCDFLEGFG